MGNLILLVLSCFILFSSLLLIRQSDFKSLVAYSSVLHISFCSFRLLNFNFIRSFGGIFIRLCHGFVSPLIFLFVYYFYQIFNSRKILRNSSFSKIFILIFTFTYLLNLRFPLLGGFSFNKKIFTFKFYFTFIFCFTYYFYVFNYYNF